MPAAERPSAGGASQRLDKWLWHARLTKSRSLSSQIIEEGKIRVNRDKVLKPSHCIRPGDVITATLHGDVRVLKVLCLPVRRGPPAEARLSYEDLLPAAGRAALATRRT